jgi:hypothetical protein
LTARNELVAERRIAEAMRRGSRSLDLHGLGLRSLPQSLFNLVQLEELHLSLNELAELPESLAELSRLRKLYLSMNEISNLPEAIGSLGQLMVLDLSNNRLSVLPRSVGGLLRLHSLNLSANRIAELPSAVLGLRNLCELNLTDNCLEELPADARQLSRLKQLFLHGNPKLELLSEALGPRDEDVWRNNAVPLSPKTILDLYFGAKKSRPLNEAKMILVGRSGAGKTSIVNRLVQNEFGAVQDKTDGIEITRWTLPSADGDAVRVNVWDFGMRIFISGVSGQFKACRDQVASDLRAVGAEVKVQEDFQQYGGTLLEKLQDYITGCDRVIALVGDAYGAEPDRAGLSPQMPRRSYTQWEYFLAQGERLKGGRQAAKDTFVYLASPNFVASHAVRQTDEEGKLQQEFIKAIRRSGKDRNQFGTLDELCRLVLRDGFKMAERRRIPDNSVTSSSTAVIEDKTPLVFICHASEDKVAVRTYAVRLREAGFATWLDEEQLLPGQEWDVEIRKAIARSNAVIVFLSTKSQKRGYVQREIVLVLEEAERQPEGTIFVIPAKLEPCEVPNRLSRWQWVDLANPAGFKMLCKSLGTLRDMQP